MPTVDADCHVIEIERTWNYLDEGDAKYKPMRIKAPGDMGHRLGDECWVVDGRLIRRGPTDSVATTQESREMISVDARLHHMDELGVDIQVLYPTIFLRPITNRPEIELALVKAYNHWLADIWEKGGGRLRWTALMPFLSIDRCAVEMKWAKAHGACGVFMRGFEAERHLGDPYFFPVYEAAEGLDLPVCAHAGNASFMIEEFYSQAGGLSVFKFPVIDGFLSLIQGKVPDRFPKLRFGFVEVAAQWVPYAVHFLMGRNRRSMKLSDLLKENRLYVACQTDDDLPYVLKYAGEDNIVIGSDYGHADASSEIAALRHLQETEELEPAAVRKILDANPCALYGL